MQIRLVRALALGLTLAVGSSACYGSFTATRKLHAWNGSVSDNKFVNELVFLGLVILPVYGLFTLGDGLIFNSIEFWSGSNPIAAGEVEVESLADGVRLRTDSDRTVVLRPNGRGEVSVWIDDLFVGHARFTEAGGLVFLDEAQGRSVALDRDQVAALRAALEPAG